MIEDHQEYVDDESLPDWMTETKVDVDVHEWSVKDDLKAISNGMIRPSVAEELDEEDDLYFGCGGYAPNDDLRRVFVRSYHHVDILKSGLVSKMYLKKKLRQLKGKLNHRCEKPWRINFGHEPWEEDDIYI